MLEVNGKRLRFPRTLWVQYGGVKARDERDGLAVEGVDAESYVKVFNHFGRVLKLFTFEEGRWIDTDTGGEVTGLDESLAGHVVPAPAQRAAPAARSKAKPAPAAKSKAKAAPPAKPKGKAAGAAKGKAAPAKSGAAKGPAPKASTAKAGSAKGKVAPAKGGSASKRKIAAAKRGGAKKGGAGTR